MHSVDRRGCDEWVVVSTGGGGGAVDGKRYGRRVPLLIGSQNRIYLPYYT